MYLKLRQFLSGELGAAAIEYGLIAAGISIAVITLLGHATEDVRFIFDYLRQTAGSLNLRLLS